MLFRSKVREAANRMSCSNNLKQLGTALHSYESSFGYFPKGQGPSAAAANWRVLILPFIEQESVFKLVNQSDTTDPASPVLSNLTLKTFNCPSMALETNKPVKPGWATFQSTQQIPSYIGLMGAYPDPAGRTTGAWVTSNYGGWLAMTGMLLPNENIRLADCLDGTSNTFFIGEQSGRVGTNDYRNGYFAPFGGATFTQRLLAVRSAVDDYLAPLMVGRDPQRIEELWQLGYQNSYWRNSPVLNNALSGVDQALWDIKGKIAGLPLYQLLGGSVRDGATVYRHADGRDPQEVLDDVLRLREEGYTHIRCQMGGYGGIGIETTRGPGFDPVAYRHSVPRLFEHVRAAVGPSLRLLHDVHERLAPIDAIRLAKALEPYDLFFLEDPLPPEEQGWFRMLREQTATPIAMGELFTHPLEWRPLIAEGLIDFIRVHISDIGGITPARKVAALAEAFGVRTAFHGPGDVSPVGHAANVHLDVAVPNFGIQELSPMGDELQEVFPGCPELRAGALHPNERPGLGIDIDEGKAARDRKSTRLNSSHIPLSRMPSSA